MAFGALTATEAYGQEITPIVSKAQFIFDQQALFQLADKNADRVIVSNEVVTFRRPKSDEKLEGQFNELDADFSGFLTKDEILAAHEKLGDERRKRQKRGTDKFIKKFDLDSNGEISSYEIDQVQVSLEEDFTGWRQILASKGLQSALSGSRGERYKTLLDTDSNGSVSEDEFQKHIQRLSERRRKYFQRQRDNLTKKFDLDNNGTISSTEIDEAKTHKEKEMVERLHGLAQKDFEYKDVDKNKVVSLEEYKNSHRRPGNNGYQLLEKGTFLSRDINDDGEIHFAENEEFIESLFLRLDVDNDDQLSAMEQKASAFKRFQKISFTKVRIRK